LSLLTASNMDFDKIIEQSENASGDIRFVGERIDCGSRSIALRNIADYEVFKHTKVHEPIHRHEPFDYLKFGAAAVGSVLVAIWVASWWSLLFLFLSLGLAIVAREAWDDRQRTASYERFWYLLLSISSGKRILFRSLDEQGLRKLYSTISEAIDQGGQLKGVHFNVSDNSVSVDARGASGLQVGDSNYMDHSGG